MTQATKVIFVIVLSFGLLGASCALAAGIVPCGQHEDDPDTIIDEHADCTLCHFFILITMLVNFVLFKLTAPLALLMLIIGGAMFMLAAGNPNTVTQARKLITSVLIGIVIIYGAYFLIGVFLQSVGLAEWTSDIYEKWWDSSSGPFTIECDVPETATTPPPAPPAFTPPVPSPSSWTTIDVNTTLNNNGNLFTFHTKPIYSMAVSGEVNIKEAEGYARIVLTDESGKEYLVYEANGPFDSGVISFDKWCDETCVLEGIIPKSVDAEMSGANIKVSQLFTLEDERSLEKQVKTMGIQSYQGAMGGSNEQAKIDKINNYIKENDLRWTAGETSISGYTYEEKKQIFSLPSLNQKIEAVSAGASLPNVMAFTFYSGGIFELGSYGIIPFASPNFPKEFDWRDQHGINWMTPVENQGMCGACWAFSGAGTVEAVTRIYFNQQLNINLSEQELISCERLSALRPCSGNYIYPSLNYCKQNGITTRSCFPFVSFSGITPACASKPSQCEESITKISGWYDISPDLPITSSPREIEETLKETIIKHGPVTVAIYSLSHAMIITGWETDPKDNKPVWITKSSYGEFWGENGYVRMKIPFTDVGEVIYIIPPITISGRPELEISCTDKDSDGYCWWGISEEKPATCPASCRAEKDCDDSDPQLGTFDSNYNCRSAISPAAPIVVSSISPLNAVAGTGVVLGAEISSTLEIDRCNFFLNDANRGEVELSKSPCLNCRAKKNHTFSSAGYYSAYIKCWDVNNNTGVGSSVTITVDAIGGDDEDCPDCSASHTDLCESPPKCEADCGGDERCDEKQATETWITNNICHRCNANCIYNSDPNIPSRYQLSGNSCYFNCPPVCDSSGWSIAYNITNCGGLDNCPEVKVSDENCYYHRSCGTSGCRYLNTDNDKACSGSVCTDSGWDNSECQPYNKELYITEGFNNPDDYVDEYLYCDPGDTLVSGDCLPDDRNDIVVFNSPARNNGWRCRFECYGWCTADGTMRITCQP